MVFIQYALHLFQLERPTTQEIHYCGKQSVLLSICLVLIKREDMQFNACVMLKHLPVICHYW